MKNNSEAPKRRGRPPGSKNKKTRVSITNGTGLQVLEVPAGRDVIAAVYDFTNRHRLEGVSVTSTHGFVRNVTLYQPNKPIPFFTYRGAYQLLYLMGNFYRSSYSARPLSPVPTRHVVSFECGGGRLCHGAVQGKLTAATSVVLGLSFINGTESIKLPLSPPCALPAPQNFYGGLVSGAGSSMSATGGLTEFSSGAGRFGADYVVPTVTSVPSPLSSISWNPMIDNFSSTSGSKEERSKY